MNTNLEINEMISALIDGESIAKDTDTTAIRKDPLLVKRHQEYLQIGNLIRSLPTPQPSSKFVEEVLGRLPKKRSNNIVRLSFSLAAAAALLVAFAVGLYGLLPESPKEPAVNNMAAPSEPTPSLIHLDVPETTLASIQIENIEDNELEKTLAVFEVVPEEVLLIALAELVVEEETVYFATTEGIEVVSPWDENILQTPYSFVDIYTELETLNQAEVATFNELMRTTLATT